ncbi:ribonuclease HI family protein [Vulgatibacter sp.]|uniref:ribonuclease HI family protein n=1 Tax=Vulgatibacter sp. TaxID=1971226 RepID=UPI0035666930
MDKPSPAEVLRFMAREEAFEHTLQAHPALARADLASLLENAARIYAAREEAALDKARAAAPAPEQPAPAARPVRKVPVGAHKRLRVYSDGAARGNPGPAGAGAVIVAPDGEIIERLGRFLGNNTNNYAEYMGLLIGLERAHELGAREVEVLADSQLMIRQLGGSYKVKAENLRPLYLEALALLRGFDAVKLVHVPREQNKDADEMSNRAIDERM